MEIIRLQSVTEAQVGEILELMRELDPEIRVTPAMVRQSIGEPRTCFFALIDGAHIVGCASLCVTSSPTGRQIQPDIRSGNSVKKLRIYK